MKRHRWGPKGGRWLGRKDVRTCEDCGLVAYKTGLFGKYRLVFPSDPLRKERRFDRMPECVGGGDAGA